MPEVEEKFPFEALPEEPVFPDYNDYLENIADGYPVEMYSLAKLFQYEQEHDAELWAQCDKCKVDGHKREYVFPSIVIPKQSDQLGKAKLVILGEAPGKDEDKLGMGYVGDSGQLLFAMLTQMWKSALPTIMLGNSIWCWPTGNKTPTVGWYKNCGGNLWPRILCDRSLIDDKALIVATGATPWKMLHACADGSPSATSITAARGAPTELSFTYSEVTRTFPVFPTYHPAVGIRNPERIPDLQDDFQKMYACYARLQTLEEGESVVEGRDDNTIDLDNDLIPTIYTKMLEPKMVDDLIRDLEAIYKDYEDKTVSYDVETANLNTADPANFVRLAGFGAIDGHTWQFTGHGLASIGDILRRLKAAGFKIVGHNIWFDLIESWKMRYYENVDELPEVRDTQVIHKLIDENCPVNKLKYLCTKYFGVPDWSAPLQQFTDAKGVVNWVAVPTKDLQKYHRGDLWYNLKLYYYFMELCAGEEVSGYWVVDYVEFKSMLLKELLQTSINGFRIDQDVLRDQIAIYDGKIEESKSWFQQPYYQRVMATLRQMDPNVKDAVVKSLANVPLVEEYDPEKDIFNPNSTDQLAALLAATLDDTTKTALFNAIGKAARTKGGKVSLNEENLTTICETLVNMPGLFGKSSKRYDHLIEGVKKVLDFRGLTKITGTYLRGMVKNSWSDLSVRCHWNVDGAATGRLSAVNPNMQNIPRGDTADMIKALFIPRYEGYLLMQFDLSQAELRGLGSFTHDANLKHAYDEGLDLHTYTASGIYHVPMDQVVKHQRQVSKMINFASVYGATASLIAKKAELPVAEAQQVLDHWFGFYKNVGPWMEARGQEVEEQGFCVGLWGLKRRLPMSMATEADGADLKRQAGNFPIQNFASDFNCFLMLKVMERVKEEGLRPVIRMVNTVHDSIVFEVMEGYESHVARFYYEAMTEMNEWCKELFGDPETYVTMKGDLEIGLNYGKLVGAKVDPETYEVSIVEKE